ncbi:DUF86 domain-containing protein, partial [Mesorhizobium sp. M8A.F.Ca.ET.202.01.1.1]
MYFVNKEKLDKKLNYLQQLVNDYPDYR